MGTFDHYKTLLVRREESRLYVTINRPEVKNALSDEVIEELTSLVEAIEPDRTLRSLIMRGAGGTFCAGADIKGFFQSVQSEAPATGPDPIAVKNRAYGTFLLRFNRLPLTTIGVIEGAAFGGGLGLMCVFDVVICARDTKFALSETGLGIPPAQIAPFVVRRVGLTTARRIALTGARFDGAHAYEIGLANFLASDATEIEAILNKVLNDIGRCAPGANAVTKEILLSSLAGPLDQVLDDASQAFARQLRSEGREGVAAFIEKRAANWVDKVS